MRPWDHFLPRLVFAFKIDGLVIGVKRPVQTPDFSPILLCLLPVRMTLRYFMCEAICRRLILVAIFVNLVFLALSDDAKYEACAPQSCGYGPSISYPFWISGEQDSYCGYPNFEVSCKGNYPVLNISGSEFFIRNIFPSNHSFILVSGLVFEDSCAAPPRNISLERMPFNLSSANSYLLFYYNCTSQPTSFTYPVECASDSTHHSFAIFLADTVQETDWSTAISSCDSPISVPVDVNADINSLVAVNYTDIIEMGFLLNWTATNCSNCEESEGRCGFDNNDIVCFCQDGPHARTCNDGKCTGESIFCFCFLTEFSYQLLCFIFHFFVRRLISASQQIQWFKFTVKFLNFGPKQLTFLTGILLCTRPN